MNVKNWENVIDEMGEFCIIIRTMALDNMLRDGLVADVYVENYGKLADFALRYDICMITLQEDFVRLMVHMKR